MPTTTTSTTQGPCDNTCPSPDWRDSPIYPPWVIGTSTTTTLGPTPTTTTFTTEGPCPGECRYDWNTTDKAWVKTSSSCGPGCACTAPFFCPPQPNSPACTVTPCFRSGYDASAPNCTGTTSSLPPGCTPSTTTRRGCIPGGCSGCDWFCNPVTLTWNPVVGDCDPCEIDCRNLCPIPARPCFGDCSAAHTDCLPVLPPPPPPPGCGGSCTWLWIPAHGLGPGAWGIDPRSRSGCYGGFGGCLCRAPGFDGTYCAEPVITGCFESTPTTTTPPPGGFGCIIETPLTTASPAGCAGNCVWRGDGAGGWIRIDGCPGCGCAAPAAASTATCSLTQTPCVEFTTTTTTRIGGTTTTTTAGPCPGMCSWVCSSGVWNLEFGPCGGVCGCQYPLGPCLEGQYSTAGCAPGGTTTTTTTPPVNCLCKFGVLSPAQGPCASAAAQSYQIDAAGPGGAGCAALIPTVLWNMTAAYTPSACFYEENATDPISGNSLHGTVNFFFDGSDPTHAVIIVVLANNTTGDSVTLRYDGATPLDCCSSHNVTAVGGSCAGDWPVPVGLTPIGTCTCDDTTTTTTLPPGTTTTTTPGTAIWCLQRSICPSGNCSGACVPDATRRCETWVGTPPACVGGGSTSQRRTVVSGPYSDIGSCNDADCSGDTPTTTTEGGVPVYNCYLCTFGLGGPVINTCFLSTDIIPPGCSLVSGPYATLSSCASSCGGDVPPPLPPP